MKKRNWVDILISAAGAIIVRGVLDTFLQGAFNEDAFMNLASILVAFAALLLALQAFHAWRAGEYSPRSQDPDAPSMEVRAVRDKLQALVEGGRKPTVGELLNLRREANSLGKDRSLSVTEHFALWRLSDAIDDTLDDFMATNLPESPELKQLRQERARYKEALGPEFSMLMEHFLDSGSAEDTTAVGDLLFPKEHRARLLFILDHANDCEKTSYGELFANWVRLKGYSPSDVKERVDADVIQRLEVSAR